MRAGMSGLGTAAWREAWRGRMDNPLLARWQLGAARATQHQPWWRRNPGLMLLGAVLSAGATYILALLLQDIFTVSSSAVGSRAFMLGLLKSGVAVVAWAGLALSLMWLLARVYSVAAFALALLGQGRARDGAPTTCPELAPVYFQQQLQSPANALVVNAIDKHDKILLHSLHLMSCNIAHEVDYGRYQSLLSDALCQTLANAASKVSGHRLTSKQSSNLSDLQQVLAEIKAEKQYVFQLEQSVGRELSQPGYPQEMALLLAGKPHWVT